VIIIHETVSATNASAEEGRRVDVVLWGLLNDEGFGKDGLPTALVSQSIWHSTV